MTMTPKTVSIALLMIGCAANPGTQPHDMSVAGHSEAAAQEEQAAQAHERKASPDQLAQCGRTPSSEPSQSSLYTICWSTVTKMIQQQEREAQQHRDAAAEHRKAARTLQEAEETSCGNISEYDRDLSPFYHREDIESVVELPGDAGPSGAAVRFRPVQGLTEESLRSLVDCHIARAASVGYKMPEMDYCPLVVEGAHAKVVSSDKGLVVEITSSDAAVAKEIARRANALMER